MFFTKLKVVAATLLLVSTGALLVQQATTPRIVSAQGAGEKSTQTASTAKPSSGAELDVAMLERAWPGALERSDKATVDRILADDFAGIDSAGGTVSRNGYLQQVEKGDFAPGPIEPIEIAVKGLGDTAVLTSRTRFKDAGPDRRYTKVYVKRQGRWQCVASHISMLMGTDNMTGVGSSSSGGMIAGQPGPATDQNGGGMAGMMAAMMGGRGNPSNADPQLGVAKMMRGMMGSSPSNANPQDAGGAMMGGGGSSGMMQQMMRGGGMMGSGGGMMRGNAMMGGKGMMSGGMAGMMGVGGGTPPAHAAQTTKIRPRFDCLIEKVYVGRGFQVKKGDRLADLFSIELARAKNDFLSARMQKENDQRNLDMRRKLVESAAISSQVWLDSQNAANKSNLAYQTARDNLVLLGLNQKSIDVIDKEEGEQKARMTLRSPVDGTVGQVSVQDGDLCDTKIPLVVIEANAPEPEKQPAER